MVRCTSDKRQRILEVIKAYTAKLSKGNIVDIPSVDFPSLSVGWDAGSAASVRSSAITLARDAFGVPPRYYFDVSDNIPTHCLHLDLVTFDLLEDFRERQADVEFVRSYFASGEQLLWLFLSQDGPDELRSLPDMQRVAVAGRATVLTGPILHEISCAIASAVQTISCGQEEFLAVFGNVATPKFHVVARMCVILMALYEWFDSESWMKVVSHLWKLLGTACVRSYVVSLLGTIRDEGLFRRQVEFALTHLAVVIATGGSDSSRHDAASMVALLSEVNFLANAPLLSHTDFYFPLAQDFTLTEIEEDYVRGQKGGFALMDYPCLLDAGYKSALMQIEAHVEYSGAVRNAMLSSNLSEQLGQRLDSRMFFLHLRIKRSDILSTSLQELQINIGNLRKPLKITFVGEEGVDEGGLRKEFFQLLCKELLSPDHGMFQMTDDNQIWFVSDQKNNYNRREYWLIGMVIGLAVFNNIVLDVSFPMVLFQKLLGLPASFQDLESIDAELYQGLNSLLTFTENGCVTVEEVYCRNFEFCEDIFGASVVSELCPGGIKVPLTLANREEYVRLTVDHVLGRMVESNFGEFKRGFDQVCGREMIQKRHVHAKELELLVCGRHAFDLRILEETTSYEGFKETDQTIIDFWHVVHGFTQGDKMRFLKFCTGSSRAPARGLGDLRFVIGKNGDNSALLPTAHTCFNHLLLPQYNSRDVLRSKMLLAIQNCEGFGLR